ncbi:serpin-ZX-like [Rhododendron vialii]|uniref:serpin-ZX-like n=1 Tax=Rhododendron vialii TaxID=182163 RepID=UPI00265FCDEF|nr:serpin-ZX-like [Rhododendron vialii]
MEFCTQIANQLMLMEIQNSFGKNIVSSPLSTNAVLNMVVAGSTDHTLKHMLGFLGSKNVDEINSKSRKMMAVATGGGGKSSEIVGNGPILTMVNGAWADRRFPLVSKYKEDVLKGIFNCEANNEVLQHGSVDPETVLILANRLYFKGLWDFDYEFDARSTEKRKFYLQDGSIVLVPFMTTISKDYYYRSSSKDYYYGLFDGFKVLKIPYQSCQPNNFSMYFFLPEERDGLQNLIRKLNSDSRFLSQEYFELTEETLEELWIPKFKFSFDFNVLEVIDDMGVSFSSIGNPRDLSEMVHNTDDVEPFLLKMFQKAYIEIDEKGTEAAAITHSRAVPFCSKLRPQNKRYNFVADHPFVISSTAFAFASTIACITIKEFSCMRIEEQKWA